MFDGKLHWLAKSSLYIQVRSSVGQASPSCPYEVTL